MTKQQTIELLQKQLPGFYSVEQVINIINGIKESGIDLKELVDQITDEIVSEELDLIEDYDLDMNYREVELSSVTISESTIRRAIERVIDENTPDEEAIDEHRATRD
jgi:hypothetical protein